MTDDPKLSNPFHALKNQSEAAVDADLDRKWEHSKVILALNRLKLGHRKKELTRAAITETEEAYLHFTLFADMFPTFPVRLYCDRLKTQETRTRDKDSGHIKKQTKRAPPLHQNPKAFFPVWFKNFLSLPPYKRFEELFDQAGEVRELMPIGLVFPRKGFRNGMILHNGDVFDFVAPTTGCHLYIGGGKKPMNLVVQGFDSFLDCIRDVQKWTPEQ